MKKPILVISTLIILFSVACKGKPEKTSEEILKELSTSKNINVGTKHYTVDFPKGWTLTDTILSGIKFRFIRAPKTDANALLNIINESMQNKSLDIYKSLTIINLRKDLPNFVKLDEGDFFAYDLKGIWFNYTYEKPNIKRDIICYIIPNNGIAYIITAGTKLGAMKAYRSTFDSVAKSFRFVR